MALRRDRTSRRAGRRRGTGRSARSSSPSSTCVSSPASASIACLSCRSCSSSGVSATISPPVVWRPSVAVELAPRASARPRRLGVEAHVGEQPRVRAGGLARGQLVDRDLEVEAARVRPGRLAVQLAALEQRRPRRPRARGSTRAPSRRGRRRRPATSVSAGSGPRARSAAASRLAPRLSRSSTKRPPILDVVVGDRRRAARAAPATRGVAQGRSPIGDAVPRARSAPRSAAGSSGPGRGPSRRA